MPSHTRDDAWSLLTTYTEGASLRKHALAVAACMRAYALQQAHARELSAAETARMSDLYESTGLLHDFDYEKYPTPEQHPYVGVRILEEQGWPAELRHAIMGHAEYTGTPRVSLLDKTLFACDELAGLITACALVKPSRAIADVDVASVTKKMKDKAFARGCNRDDIRLGAEELGVPLPEHIATCLAAMQAAHVELGL